MPKKELIYQNVDLVSVGKKINIIHFNDVYNIESGDIEPKAGAARFIKAVEDIIQNDSSTIVLFSGDAISPSNLSMIVKGKQMIDILNKSHIACACLGNHDFDFGLDVLLNHIENSNFPWLLSNVFDIDTKLPLGNVKDRHIIEINDIRIGIIGLVEEEWITTLSTINYDDIIYESYVEIGQKLANELKNDQGCDIVIALTHMRWQNDCDLAKSVPEIDIFLGGHDHEYSVKKTDFSKLGLIQRKIESKWVVKSGTDFREFSYIELILSGQEDKSTTMLHVDKIEKFIVDSEIEENEEIKLIVHSFMENLNSGLEQFLGYMNVELDGRFKMVRTQETNLGNFITDIMLASVSADCALLNSGSLRSDCIHPAGEFKVKDLKKILPYLDESVVLSVTGAQLLETLENSVSQYPKHEGRFLQVSGVQFAFDPSKPGGSRIDHRLVKVQDEYLDLTKEYSVITKIYLKQGKDGFDCLKDCPVLIDEENIPMLYNLVENHFKTIAKLKKDRNLKKFRSSIVPLFIVNRLINTLSDDPTILSDEGNTTTSTSPMKMNFQNAAFLITRMLSHKNKTLTKLQRIKIKQSENYKQKLHEYEEKAMKLSPQIENRIICIRDEEHLNELLKQRESQPILKVT